MMGCFPCFGSASQREEEEEVKKRNEGKGGGGCKGASLSHHGGSGEKVGIFRGEIFFLRESRGSDGPSLLRFRSICLFSADRFSFLIDLWSYCSWPRFRTFNVSFLNNAN